MYNEKENNMINNIEETENINNKEGLTEEYVNGIIDAYLEKMTDSPDEDINDDDCDCCCDHEHHEEDEDRTLDLILLNGEVYTVDVETITTEEFLDNVDNLDTNVGVVRFMLQNLLTMSIDDENYETYVENMINELSTFTSGFGVKLNYDSTVSELTRREIAILMASDVINIISTIHFWVKSYKQINTLFEAMSTPFNIENFEKENIDNEDC